MPYRPLGFTIFLDLCFKSKITDFPRLIDHFGLAIFHINGSWIRSVLSHT